MTAPQDSLNAGLVERLRARAKRYRSYLGNALYYGDGDAELDREAADALTLLEGVGKDRVSAQSQPKSTLHGAHTEAEPSAVWRPIASASADGCRILVAYTKGDTCVIEIRQADGDWWRSTGAGPTHWMPLPEAPR